MQTLKRVIELRTINSNSFIEQSYLGSLEFDKAFHIQRHLWQIAKTKNQISILGLEHPAVITLGRRMKLSDLLLTTDSIPVVESTRGGLATIHSEGQLVIYPIVNLKTNNLGVKQFVKHLLNVTQTTLKDFQIETFIDDENIGIYTTQGKIAFCGLEIKEGISQHGISINIANDLTLFSQIVSCGVTALKTDRVSNHRVDVTLRDFFNRWTFNFNQALH